jgi:hypothetical protein
MVAAVFRTVFAQPDAGAVAADLDPPTGLDHAIGPQEADLAGGPQSVGRSRSTRRSPDSSS